MHVPSLHIDGSGGTSLSIDDLRASTLRVTGAGALKAELAGEVTDQSISDFRRGRLPGGQLVSDNATVDVSGAGKVVVNARKTLKASDLRRRRRRVPRRPGREGEHQRHRPRQAPRIGGSRRRRIIALTRVRRISLQCATRQRRRVALEQQRQPGRRIAIGVDAGQRRARRRRGTRPAGPSASARHRRRDRADTAGSESLPLRADRTATTATAAPRRRRARRRIDAALITAVGSPTAARSLRIALLANTCAPTSRCAARPATRRQQRLRRARQRQHRDPGRGELAPQRLRERHSPLADGSIAQQVRRRAPRSRCRRGTADARSRVRRRARSARARARAPSRARRAMRARPGARASARYRSRRPRPACWPSANDLVPRQRAVLAQDRGERGGIVRARRQRDRAGVPPSMPATTINGSAKTVTPSAPSADRRVARMAPSSRHRCR